MKCYPSPNLRFASKWTTTEKITKYIWLINLIALLFNIPRFMCWKWKDGKAVKTDLYENPTFKTSYRIWINFIFLFVIPLIILIVLNSLLFSEVRKSNYYDVQMILVEDHVSFGPKVLFFWPKLLLFVCKQTKEPKR